MHRHAHHVADKDLFRQSNNMCPTCGGAMRIHTFITNAATVRDLLAYLG